MADKTTKIPMERQIHPVVISPFTSILRGEVTLEYVSTIPKTDKKFIIPNIDNPPPDAIKNNRMKDNAASKYGLDVLYRKYM